MLLILLLGKYWVYSNLRSGSQTTSSHTFLPRSSSSGREQKSSSHTSLVGAASALLLLGSCTAASAPAARRTLRLPCLRAANAARCCRMCRLLLALLRACILVWLACISRAAAENE
jgi:hypothetical protein